MMIETATFERPDVAGPVRRTADQARTAWGATAPASQRGRRTMLISARSASEMDTRTNNARRNW